MKLSRMTDSFILAVCSIFLLLFTVSQIVLPITAQARDLVIAYESDPDTLDLLSARHGPTAEAVGVNIMEHLLDTTPDGDLIPGLAKEWKISPDKRTIEFKLRNDVKFHSGDPLTTEDVVFSFNRIKEKTRATNFRFVKELKVIDDYSFQVIFTQPDVLFLKYRGFFIGSKKYYDRVGEDTFIKKVSGPDHIKSWTGRLAAISILNVLKTIGGKSHRFKKCIFGLLEKIPPGFLCCKPGKRT